MADDKFEPELTDEERRAIRKVIRDRERAEWFWSSVRIWALGVTAVIGAITLTYDAIARFIKSIGGG